MESVLYVGTTHWEHDSPYYACFMLQEIPWENHDCHIATFLFMWRKPLGEIEEAFMADFLDGVSWAILGGHNISAQK